MSLIENITRLVGRVMALKPARVMLRYGAQRGPILSAGLSFQAIFAVFAAIWVGFAIAGFVIRANPELQSALIEVLSSNVPGLIKGADGQGAIDPEQLLSSSILGWTGAIAAVGVLFTAVGWLGACREAIRNMFGMPSPTTFILVTLAKDFVTALGFGALLLLSAALSVFSTSALSAVFGWLGVDTGSGIAIVVGRIVGLLLTLLLDTIVLGLFFRVVSGVHIPTRQLAEGTILGAVALGVLKALGSSLLTGATSNPLLASFAVIVGLLVWFNLVCQVILIAASWIWVSAHDRGVSLGSRGARSFDGAPGDVRTAL